MATGHCFNDGNKRTAHAAMDACLEMNGVEIAWTVEEVGPLVVEVAQGRVSEERLAGWLRGKAGG